MRRLRKPVYLTAGYNTISMGSGRSEFHPKKPRPGLEHYLREAGQGALAQIGGADAVDEGVISNFMAARFNRQGNLAGMIPLIDPKLEFRPCVRVEGACGSGGLALVTAMKSILAETADVVLAVGVEVQNTVKAVYGADILAGAGHYETERKTGHAYFFPGKFSDRAGAYLQKFGQERTRKAMAQWYAQCIEHARRCPKAQEYENRTADLVAAAMASPTPETFVEHLNFLDCSKVSDGASALICASAEGLQKLGMAKSQAVEIVGFGQVEADLTKAPEDLTKLGTTQRAVQHAFAMSGLSPKDIGVLELHDCFTITALLALEATGFASYGEAAELIQSGVTRWDGPLPTNGSGGLIGFGHYTGGTGVRQAVDLLSHLTGKADGWQVKNDPARPHGLMISMGGNDRTVVALICRKS